MQVLTDTDFLTVKPYKKGKVRDLFEIGDNLLIICTDRISAFDVVMTEGIPGKGEILNRLTAFWFNQTRDIIENHMITTDIDALPSEFREHRSLLEGRTMLVRKTRPLPVECVVRGYLTGGGWKEYREKGSVSGVSLPDGLQKSAKLETPIFTPSTKADIGEHDESISFERVREVIGEELAERVRELSLKLYEKASRMAEEKGIIIADTKFEFGLLNGSLILIDEIFTPDSSRFWLKESYEPGRDQESLDKQFLRDWLESVDWDKTPPPPSIPQEIVEQTAERYLFIKKAFLES